MRVKILLLLALIIFIFSGKIYSQYSTTGTEFWLSFHQNFEDNANPILYITSDVGATGTVSIPGTGWSQNFTVAINSSVTVNLPSADAIIATGNTVLNRGVHVESTTAIAVYAANQRTASSDATLIYPVHALGDAYIVNAYSPFSGNPSQFVVVGVQDNTSIEIIPSSNITGGVNAGVPFNITLNTGQVYFIRSNGDLTGTSVKATSVGVCNDFAVFAGNKCANVPLSCTYCDHLYEQMIPTKAWGREYVTVPLMTRNGDQYRVMAMEDNTIININNGANIMLNSGQFHETYLQPSSFIVGDKPISVAQYSRGTSCDGVTSDPFMIMLSPIEQTLDYIVFQAFTTTNINQFYTNIVTKTEHTNQVLLNGATIPGWTTVPSNPDFSYNRRNIAQGTHVLQSSHGLLATVYGFGDVESYGYQAGANIQPLNVSFDIIVDGDSVAFDIFQDSLNCQQAINGVSFNTDATNITNIHWDFGDGNTATGPNVSHIYSSSGMFTVTMHYTRMESCVEESLSVDVFVTSELPPFDFINDTVVCNGVPFTIYPGAAGVNYLWQDGTTNSYYNVSTSGTYSLTVSDDMGCYAEATAEVLFVNMQLQTDVDDITCAGMADGSITVNASGGDAPYSYSWSTIPTITTQTVSSLDQGTYFVTVTDANGCTLSTSANIVNPETFYGEIVLLEHISCYGASDGVAEINVQGGAPPYEIVWSNSSLFGMIQQDLDMGNYSFTVSDVNGCISEHSFTINQPDSITVLENLLNAACHGEPVSVSISPSGGTSPYTIYWESEATGFTNSNIPTNTDFSYTVTDANSCSYISYVHVTSPSPIELQTEVYDVTCAGMADGSITVNASGGDAPYSYSWSTIPTITTQTVSGLGQGTYFVTVTDANGCTLSTSANIVNPETFYGEIVLLEHISCYGASDGVAEIHVHGGVPPYGIVWSNSSLFGVFQQDLNQGNYSFTVNDVNGCISEHSFTINQPDQITVFQNLLNAACHGQPISASISPSGGTSPYTIYWESGATGFTNSNIPANTDFAYTVTDANSCSYISYVNVTSPPPFVIVPNITPVKCYGDLNGGIRISVSGSTPPIQIEWSSGEDSVAIANKPAGYYTVTIRDANNCAESESFYIPESDAPLTLDYTVNDLRCFGDLQGSIFLAASGGTHPYSYRLNNGQHEVNGNNHAALIGGPYSFRVIDAYGCEVAASAIINEPAPLEAELLTQRPSCIGNNDGFIKVNVFGGTEPYIYNFDNKLSDFNSYTRLKQGIFELTVYDANNCKKEFDNIRLVDVPVDCITIPNAFTPNGDGINDTWIIDNIEMFPDAVINVFNRWGQEVFFARGNSEPWDGTYEGKFLPTGSYVYVVNLQNGTKEYKGTVTIIY